MGSQTRTRPLTPQLYLTNERQLVYVLDIADEGQQAVVEDAATGEVQCVMAKLLNGWRIVVPSDAS